MQIRAFAISISKYDDWVKRFKICMLSDMNDELVRFHAINSFLFNPKYIIYLFNFLKYT